MQKKTKTKGGAEGERSCRVAFGETVTLRKSMSFQLGITKS